MDKQKGRGRFVFLCLAPAVILFTVFMVIPTINVFRMSLYKWGGYSANQEFVGLDNFKKLFADPKFYQSFQNTILLIVIVTIITFAFALVFAAILSREKIKGQIFFRVIFYIPNILSVVVISAIFSAIYDPNNGMLNSLIALFREPGEVPTLWLGNQQLVIYSFFHHDPAGVDKHPNDAHVFHHQYHQPVVPVRQGDDQRRAGRRQRGHPELYV